MSSLCRRWGLSDGDQARAAPHDGDADGVVVPPQRRWATGFGRTGKWFWKAWSHAEFFGLLVGDSLIAALVLVTQYRRLKAAAMPPEGQCHRQAAAGPDGSVVFVADSGDCGGLVVARHLSRAGASRFQRFRLGPPS